MTQVSTNATPPASPMSAPGRPAARGDTPALVAALLIFQVLCVAVFLWDVAADFWEAGWLLFADMRLLPELAGVLGLIMSIAFVGIVLRRILTRQHQLETGLRVASGALGDLIEGYFEAWALTPTEQDVATYTIKGYSIAEVASLRGSAEGTVKTHLNAIYRKAGVSGRAQLVSLLVEDLMRETLIGRKAD